MGIEKVGIEIESRDRELTIWADSRWGATLNRATTGVQCGGTVSDDLIGGRSLPSQFATKSVWCGT